MRGARRRPGSGTCSPVQEGLGAPSEPCVSKGQYMVDSPGHLNRPHSGSPGPLVPYKSIPPVPTLPFSSTRIRGVPGGCPRGVPGLGPKIKPSVEDLTFDGVGRPCAPQRVLDPLGSRPTGRGPETQGPLGTPDYKTRTNEASQESVWTWDRPTVSRKGSEVSTPGPDRPRGRRSSCPWLVSEFGARGVPDGTSRQPSSPRY